MTAHPTTCLIDHEDGFRTLGVTLVAAAVGVGVWL